MTVSGIGSTSQALANTAIDPTSWQTRMQQTLGPVAQLFGMTHRPARAGPAERREPQRHREQRGRLADRPDRRDQSRASSRRSRRASAPLSDTQLTNMANRIAGHHRHHHHGGTERDHRPAHAVDLGRSTAVGRPAQVLPARTGCAETPRSTSAARPALVAGNRASAAVRAVTPVGTCSRRSISRAERELAHERGLGAGAGHEPLDVGEDHGAALVGVEEAVVEVVAGAEVQLGDAVDRVAAGRVRAAHDVLRVVPQPDVVPHARAACGCSVQWRTNCSWVSPSARCMNDTILTPGAYSPSGHDRAPTRSDGGGRPATPRPAGRARAARRARERRRGRGRG